MSTTTQAPPDEAEILRAIRMRLAALQPLVAEYTRLEDADKRLEKALKPS